MWGQEDNAGGHGMKRCTKKTSPDFGKLVENKVHKELTSSLAKVGITLIHQAANSPDFNRNDLGFLRMLDKRSTEYWREIKAALTKPEKEWVQYSILKRVFDDDTKTTPQKMMNISDYKTNVLQWVFDNDGEMAPRDLHFGIRKKQRQR